MNFRRTLKEWRESLVNLFKPAKKLRSKPTRRKPRAYRLQTVGVDGRIVVHRINAMTKSEARAILKKKLGVDRLPIGCGRAG